MATIPHDPGTDTVHLPTPRLQGGLTLEAALKKRHSTREFLPDPLGIEQVSALLWAGFGVNRPGRGRTAPSVSDAQEITVYAVLPEGTWRYDAREHRLLRVRTGDLRALTGTQEFAASAPLNLVYVIDYDRLDHDDGMNDEEHGFIAGAVVGCIVENIYLYCVGAGLATVVRGQIDRRRLADALGLRSHHRVAMAQSVGFAVPTQH
jgi:nitroreductase